MLTNKLFNQVLTEPAVRGGNRLFIVSGYATAAMTFNHLDAMRQKGIDINVELIVGMCARDGLAKSNHRAFQQLMQDDFKDNFQCSYVTKMPPVHSKVYAWYKDDKPFCGFAGSANYTQTAFQDKMREILVDCPADKAYEYFRNLCDDTIYCTHVEAESLVQIYKDMKYNRLVREKEIYQDDVVEKDGIFKGLPHVRVSFLDRNGALPDRSGLNWGQREGREQNQAYIRLPTEIYNTSFFPDRRTRFTIQTDDDKVLIAVRAQDNGKAIETPQNNSLIGQYFRNRLGLSSGSLISKDDLVRYGRSHLDFYKVDNETYFMNFSA